MTALIVMLAESMTSHIAACPTPHQIETEKDPHQHELTLSHRRNKKICLVVHLWWDSARLWAVSAARH